MKTLGQYLRSILCRRCWWLRTMDPTELVFFLDPTKPEPTPEALRTRGEWIRAEAMRLHAEAGHPDDWD